MNSNMKLSEELEYRGFKAETTIKDVAELDTRESKKFYWGADPSADSLTIGNLAALMMCACFVRHGYEPYLLVGGATGQIGDPKENGERDLKSLDEVEHNKSCIKKQIERVIIGSVSTGPAIASSPALAGARAGAPQATSPVETSPSIVTVDNYDWFRDMKYLDFLREVGKAFSMTQLLDRQFVQNRIGEGGSGISYAEFSYTLIQGYDFLHLYREYGVSLQLCGADQYGNCTSGIHLIRRLEDAQADVWSTPLVIDPVTGRKFGKSEGNAVWLAASDNGGGNYTSVFDFYQFWLNQPDGTVGSLLKIYTVLEPEEIDKILAEQQEHPERRVAQKALAYGATSVVHGAEMAEAAEFATQFLFSREPEYTDENIAALKKVVANHGVWSEEEGLLDVLVRFGLAASKGEARKLIKAGAISFNGEKVAGEDFRAGCNGVLKRGKNKFAVIEVA
ncbi:tyrosine--tRNA ligase [Candidatus Saccharibacteria bacterium]|nr:tyrosine--tRNA ligase [Candidatus Saccharibacteria bacterium]